MTSFSLKSIQKAIDGWGWQVLGLVSPNPKQAEPLVILLGNAGPNWWPAFKAMPEFADGAPHPMDRASKRLGHALAQTYDCQVVYPSDGPPYPPFLRWAQASGQAFATPLGPLLHARYGLWHAYRAALLVDDPGRVDDLSPPLGAVMARALSPCEACEARPCLSACPVTAIGEGRYDIPACLGYLEAEPKDCLAQGCAARRACPIGRDFHYPDGQAAFHMGAFQRAQSQKHDSERHKRR